MSIFYIVGKPRGGKSLTAVKTIVQELGNPDSQRFIVTNIRLNMAELAEYCHTHFKHEVDLAGRIRILEDDEAGEFWLYEPHRVFEQRKQIKLNRRGGVLDVPDFEDRGTGRDGNQGCLYVIDECHLYFPAREWQKTGSDCTYFLSQHGKLKCDVCLVTQHPDQCDKALRRLAQEFMVIRNLSREPVYGFHLGNVFRYGRCLNSPTSGNPAKFESGFMPLDMDLAKLYDTTQGVGIVGGLVPSNEKRGRSIWWLAPIGIVVFLAFLRGPAILAWGGELAMRHLIGSATQVSNKTPALNPVSQPGRPVANSSPTIQSPPAQQNASEGILARKDFRQSAETPVVMTGIVDLPGRQIVALSDGRVLHGGDGHLQACKPDGCVADGRFYPLAPLPSSAEQSRPRNRSGVTY